MKKRVSVILILSFLLCMTAIAVAAGETQSVEVKLSDLIDNYALKTDFGNIYLTGRHVKMLTHAAAKLQPTTLGDFKTDQGAFVVVRAVKFEAAVATLLIKKVN